MNVPLATGTLRATDWWGLPDDGAGLRLAGETWCGECLVVVNAGPLRCSYQWQRQAPGESPPESIPGATGPRYVVTEDDEIAGTVDNEATATSIAASPGNPTVSDSDDLRGDGPAREPDLTVAKSALTIRQVRLLASLKQ